MRWNPEQQMFPVALFKFGACLAHVHSAGGLYSFILPLFHVQWWFVRLDRDFFWISDELVQSQGERWAILGILEGLEMSHLQFRFVGTINLFKFFGSWPQGYLWSYDAYLGSYKLLLILHGRSLIQFFSSFVASCNCFETKRFWSFVSRNCPTDLLLRLTVSNVDYSNDSYCNPPTPL